MKPINPTSLTRTLVVCSALVFSCLIACQDEPEMEAYSLAGYCHHGIYSDGATVTLRELDEQLKPTGIVRTTKVSGGEGGYLFSSLNKGPRYVEVSVSGEYWPVVVMQQCNLTLSAIVDVSATEGANINVLTHLQRGRMKTLMKKGMTFAEASEQSVKEILSVFEYDKYAMRDPRLVSMKQGESNSTALVGIAAIMQQADITDDGRSDILQRFHDDLASDGDIDDLALQEQLLASAYLLDGDLLAVTGSHQDFYGVNPSEVMDWVSVYLNRTPLENPAASLFPESAAGYTNLFAMSGDTLDPDGNFAIVINPNPDPQNQIYIQNLFIGADVYEGGSILINDLPYENIFQADTTQGDCFSQACTRYSFQYLLKDQEYVSPVMLTGKGELRLAIYGFFRNIFIRRSRSFYWDNH